MWSGWVQGNSIGPLVPMVRLVPIENGVMAWAIDSEAMRAYRTRNIHNNYKRVSTLCESEIVLRG